MQREKMEKMAASQIYQTARKVALDPYKDQETIISLRLAANNMRRAILEMGYINRIRLHYGALMSMTEIMTLLYGMWLNVKPDQPDWADRDRFVLSKGHGAPAVYVALHMRGFFGHSHFKGFRRLNSILQGHPDRLKTPGIDCSTGSLGQGMPVACGMALAAQIDQSNFRIYSLMSDGECNEGSIWEAAQIASNMGLNRLTVLVDWNKKSSYGSMAGRNDVEPLAKKWEAFNWEVLECDGHDFSSLSLALHQSESVKTKPVVILCNTFKGKGIPYIENYPVKPNILLTEDRYQQCLTHLNKIEEELRYVRDS
jgi:transketolase